MKLFTYLCGKKSDHIFLIDENLLIKFFLYVPERKKGHVIWITRLLHLLHPLYYKQNTPRKCLERVNNNNRKFEAFGFTSFGRQGSTFSMAQYRIYFPLD